MRLEVPDDPDQRLRGHSDRLQRKTALGQWGQRITLGKTGVHEAQPGMAHTQDLHGPGHLAAADIGQISQDLGVVHEPRVEDVAALAAGA